MPFDPSAILRKLQENLLAKGPQNSITNVNLGNYIPIVHMVAKVAELSLLDDYIDWLENQQMVIGGRSRDEFAELAKYSPPEREEK